MRMMHRRYQSSLSENPVMTNIAQSFCLWTIGDALSQTFEKVSGAAKIESEQNASFSSISQDVAHSPQNEIQENVATSFNQKYKLICLDYSNSFDTSRCAAAGLYGGLVLGTVGHQWYKGLDWFVSKVVCPKTTSALIFSKVFLDTFVFGPIHISAFFSWMEISKGRKADEIQKKLVEDFAPTFVADSAFWIPVQILNFKFVPVPLQLTIVNVACIFECAGLSFLSKFGWGHSNKEAVVVVVEPEALFQQTCSNLVARQSIL
jgi:hypothetical protein